MKITAFTLECHFALDMGYLDKLSNHEIKKRSALFHCDTNQEFIFRSVSVTVSKEDDNFVI